MPPITAVISCVRENCIWRTFIIGFIFTGSIVGKITREITIPINAAFNIAPMPIESGRETFPPNLSFKRAIHNTRMILPSIMHGNIAGIAAITGLPVIKKEVMGVMMLKIIPQASPAYTTVKIRAAFIIGPVIYTLKF